MRQADARDVVVPDLNPDCVLHRAAGPLAEPPVVDRRAGHEPVIGLVKLIAVIRVVEKIGEVGKQIEVVADAEGRDLRARMSPRPLPLERSAVPISVAAVCGIDCTEPSDEAALYGALRNLIGGGPRAAISHAGDRKAVQRVAAAVANDGVHLAVVVGLRPRSVVVFHLERRQEMSSTDSWRSGNQSAREPFAAAADADHRLAEPN